MQNQEVKIQVLVLRAQVAGIEAQINALKQIRCSVCNGVGTTERKEGDNIYFDLCEDCEGTGYSAGEHPTL